MNAVARRNRTGMEKSRTLVLVATMRSPTIGSPDQTYLRARCAKLGRPRRATAPDFPACAASPKGDQTTYLGPRTTVRRHDDGWGARRAGWRRGAAAHSFREVHPTAGWRQESCWSWPQASAVWAGHVRNAWLGGHLLRSGVWQRHGGIAQPTQRVIAAAQELALHRQGAVLAVVAVVFGGQRVVVGVIRGPAARGTLGRLKRRPAQLG